MSARATWLDRCPMQWRAAALVLACSRAWRVTAVTVLAVAVGGAVMIRQNENVANVLAFYGPPLLAVTVFGGLSEHLARLAVWTGLFQRPVDTVPELVRVLTLRAGVYILGVALLLGGVVIGLMPGDAVPPGTLRYTILTAALWSVMVLFATSAVSTLAGQGVAGVVIAWLLSPFLLTMLMRAVEAPELVRLTVEFLLPPINAVFGFHEVLRGERPDDALRFTAQLVTFPLLCTAIVGWRLRAWARADITGSA